MPRAHRVLSFWSAAHCPLSHSDAVLNTLILSFFLSPSSTTTTMPSPPIKNESLELIDALFKEEADLDDDEYRPATKKARGGATGERKRPAAQLTDR